MKRESRCTAAILAGGKSSRMGRDKALLRLDGRPLIQHVIDRLLEVQRREHLIAEILLVTNTPAEYQFLRLPMHPDAIPEAGPLGGIYTALLRSNFPHVLVVACDLPFISAELVQFLCRNGMNSEVFALESEKGVEPLCAMYAKRCLPVIEKQLRNNILKVSDFYAEVDTRIVRLDPSLPFYKPNLLANVNTPDEFAAARRALVNGEFQRKATLSRTSRNQKRKKHHAKAQRREEYAKNFLCAAFAALRLCVRFFCFFCTDFTLKKL